VSPPFIVKICGITTEPDALLAVGFGVDAVGFILAPSPRQVTATTAADIAKRLPHDVLTVGVFRDEAPQRVVEIANHAGFGAVQLHGHETAADCRWVRERVSCTIKAFSAGERAIGRFEEFGADYLMIDGQSPGSGAVFDWRLAEGVVDPGRLIVSGGLHPGNVADAIAHLRPFGVDVATGVESSPGRKDPRKLADFVHNARAAAAVAGLRPAPSTSTDAPDEIEGGGPDDPDGPYDWSQR
jgi:phosphoribosylanthranilate isomerase